MIQMLKCFKGEVHWHLQLTWNCFTIRWIDEWIRGWIFKYSKILQNLNNAYMGAHCTYFPLNILL